MPAVLRVVLVVAALFTIGTIGYVRAEFIEAL
jgi:hypothetical protein